MLRVLSLFSGIGGFDLACRMVNEQVGDEFYRSDLLCEIDPFCQKVLTKNFKGVPIHADITTLTVCRGEFDIVIGGYPCQDNSLANQRGKGLDGDRSGLWFEMLRVIRECQPRFVLVENVPPTRNRRWDVTVRSNLEGLGYSIKFMPLSAAELGANHLRKRLFVIAYANGNRVAPYDYFTYGTQEDLYPEGASRWQNTGELRRGASGRVFLLPRSWVPRVDDGLPSRMDRNRTRGLGNAVVPQVAAIPLLDIYKTSKFTGVRKSIN